MAEPSVEDCFRLLGLRRGCDFALVKQSYRQKLYTCHPDRFQNRPELLPEAERKAKLLNQVYAVLERWYEAHGGVDPAEASDETGVEFGSDEGGETGGDVPFGLMRHYRPWMKVAGAGVLVMMLYYTWLQYFDAEGVGPRRVAPPAPVPVHAGPAAAPSAPDLGPLRAEVDARKAELEAAREASDRSRREWVRGYLQSLDAAVAAAGAELATAQAQYQRDVLSAAPDIVRAEDERTRALAELQAQSEAAKAAFMEAQRTAEAALRDAYNRWLLDQGTQAVALIRGIRTRDDSAFGVFANTEDPAKIFEFWTAGEAGAPEYTIEAKTGVAVLQPDARFFPHFRSNIFLHYAEGKQLTSMMEAIIVRHDALVKDLAALRSARDDEVQHWAERHPVGPPRISERSAAVLGARDAAAARIAAAREAFNRASRARESPQAESAYGQSGAGREWEARCLGALTRLSEAERALSAAMVH